MELIPQNYIDFLYWVKAETETFWSQDRNTPEHVYKCKDWMYGAKWIGMTEQEIEDTQAKYSIIFTPEHKSFLRILHSIDRKRRVYDDYEKDEGEYVEYPFFFNWFRDDEEISRQLNWPYNTILKDVELNVSWFKEWGEKPATFEEQKNVFTRIFQTAPKLIPITGTRY